MRKLLLLGLTLVMVGCSNEIVVEKEGSGEETPIKDLLEMYKDLTAQAEADMKDAYQGFTFRLLNELEKKEASGKPQPGNVVLSPLSAQYALGMLMNGAKGETRQEIISALNLNGYCAEEINSYNKLLSSQTESIVPQHLIDEYKHLEIPISQESVPNLETANSLWANLGFDLKEPFRQGILDCYDAESFSLDLSKPSSMKEIDRWVNDKTHGMIPSVNLDADEYLRLVLINTLYFKGGWQDSFMKDFTKEEPFYNWGTDEASLVPMMQSQRRANYAEAQGFQSVKLYYGYDQKYSMTLFVSDDASQPSLSLGTWRTLQQEMQKREVRLSVPRFQVDCEFKLVETLKALGLRRAFDWQLADFSLLSDKETFVNNIKQLTSISVDEEGTEASAATIIALETTDSDNDTTKPEPIEVILNKPFYFTIEDNQTGTILFIGHINQL